MFVVEKLNMYAARKGQEQAKVRGVAYPPSKAPAAVDG